MASHSVVFDLEDRLYGEGRAERTVREYVKWAKRLARWCDLNGLDVATLTARQVRAWIDQTVPEGRESRKQAYTSCKHLFTMLGRTDAPWEAIRVPAKPKGAPHPLNPRQAATLRATAQLHGGKEGVAVLGLLYTAARASEVAGWRWDGIDHDEATIRFWRPKRRDWHTVPLADPLADALERWRPAGAEGQMFPGNNGRPHVSATTVWTWTKRIAVIAGLDGINPRRMRATVASEVLEATGDVDAAAALLGHADPAVTRTYYTSTSMRRLRGAVAAIPMPQPA